MKSSPESYELNFVIPPMPGKDLDWLRSIDVDEHWQLFAEGPYSWGLQTFLRLMDSVDSSILLSTGLKRGAINLGHGPYLASLDPDPECFVVSLQADYPRLLWADFHIVQNQRQAVRSHSCWVPHWPQPGLVPRDPNRQRIQTVGFAGRHSNFAGGRDLWTKSLKKLGFDFKLINKDHWNDFSDIDALLGFRNFGRSQYHTKPPTKLFNAWQAGIPFIAGYDSAFRQVGCPGKDYFRVSSFSQATKCIQQLRDEPSLYESIVAAGKIKGSQFNVDQITQRWMTLIFDKIFPAFHIWENSGKFARIRWSCKVIASSITRAVRGQLRRVIR